MQATTLSCALVLDADPTARATLRDELTAAGYRAFEAADVESAVHLLDESPEPMVTLFTLDLHRYTMSGLDAARLIGVLLERKQLAERHAFVLLSAHPENVTAVLGRLLTHLGVPVVATSCSPATLREVMARASYRLHQLPSICH